MDRRSLLRFTVAGAATGIIAPRSALADREAFNPWRAPTAGSFYYTEDAPGRWSQKVEGHLPRFEREGVLVEVTTGHEMNPFEHYIVKHQLFDETFRLIAEKMFNPLTERAPVSRHNVTGHSNRIYALSVCNKHDAWLNVLDL